MKKKMLVVLLLAVLCAASALAEPWTCPACGKESDGNFCPWCGTERPLDPIVCPGCGAEFDAETAYNFCSQCGTPLQKEMPLSGIGNGNVIFFGRYEQDNNPDNGPEPIEWVILDSEDGRTLVVSKYALDARPYHTECVDITWEQCSLRAWLNNEFLNAAFTAEELESVAAVQLNNRTEGYEGYTTVGGNDTVDRVFLLSENDAFNLYFWYEEEMLCAPTDYAVANGAWTLAEYRADGRDAGSWWLRSPGEEQCSAEFVMYDGSRNSLYVDEADLSVRPAMWLDETGLWVASYHYR